DHLRLLAPQRPPRLLVGLRPLVGTVSVRAGDQDQRSAFTRPRSTRSGIADGGEGGAGARTGPIERASGASGRTRIRRLHCALVDHCVGVFDPAGAHPPGDWAASAANHRGDLESAEGGSDSATNGGGFTPVYWRAVS